MSINGIGRPKGNWIKRFWERVNKNGPIHPILKTRCWEWTGSLINGYGQISSAKLNTTYAHRASWFLHHGVDDKWVLHRCDNRKCVNPDHLFLGTIVDNIKDCVIKERHARGEKVNTAKLTEEQVILIRKWWEEKRYTQRAMAKMFKVNHILINRIIRRRTWKHVK